MVPADTEAEELAAFEAVIVADTAAAAQLVAVETALVPAQE